MAAAISALAGALPNTLQMGVDSINRAFDRRVPLQQMQQRENAFTSNGLPSFMAYQNNSSLPNYTPQSYTHTGGRNYLRTGVVGHDFKGQTGGGWYNAKIVNDRRPNHAGVMVPPPVESNSAGTQTSTRFADAGSQTGLLPPPGQPVFNSSFNPGFTDGLGRDIGAGQNDRLGLGFGRY